MRTKLAAAVLAMGCLLASPEARAAEPPAATPAEETSWYGWQTLAVDAAALTTIGVGIGQVWSEGNGGDVVEHSLLPYRAAAASNEHYSERPAPLLDTGLALYTLGPGTVHLAHGRPVHAFGSVALRTLGPTVGGAMGFAYGFILAVPVAIVAPGRKSGSEISLGDTGNAVWMAGIVSGVVLGTVAPVLVDAVLFAREPVSAAEKKTPIPIQDARGFSWKPKVGYLKRGVTLGVSGTF